MYKLKFTKLQNEILRLACIKRGEKLNQRTVARLLKVSPTAIGKALILLKDEGFIKIEKDKMVHITAISLNVDNQKAFLWKKIENLKLMYESEIVEYLEERYPGATIILFGSYGRGDDTITSDIDIAIIGRKETEMSLEIFERKLERKINIQFYEHLNQIDKYLRNNILNGIVLSGGVEV